MRASLTAKFMVRQEAAANPSISAKQTSAVTNPPYGHGRIGESEADVILMALSTKSAKARAFALI
jgi:hypothetical protein